MQSYREEGAPARSAPSLPLLFLLQGAEPRARPALPLSDMFDIRLFYWKPTKYQTYSYSVRAAQHCVPPAWAQRPPPVPRCAAMAPCASCPKSVPRNSCNPPPPPCAGTMSSWVPAASPAPWLGAGGGVRGVSRARLPPCHPCRAEPCGPGAAAKPLLLAQPWAQRPLPHRPPGVGKDEAGGSGVPGGHWGCWGTRGGEVELQPPNQGGRGGARTPSPPCFVGTHGAAGLGRGVPVPPIWVSPCRGGRAARTMRDPHLPTCCCFL